MVIRNAKAGRLGMLGSEPVFRSMKPYWCDGALSKRWKQDAALWQGRQHGQTEAVDDDLATHVENLLGRDSIGRRH